MKPGAFQGHSTRAERFSEYFDFSGDDGKDKALKPVRRFELQAMLTQYHRAQQSRALHRRLWRYLTTHQSWAQTAIPAPSKRQVERGEGGEEVVKA